MKDPGSTRAPESTPASEKTAPENALNLHVSPGRSMVLAGLLVLIAGLMIVGSNYGHAMSPETEYEGTHTLVWSHVGGVTAQIGSVLLIAGWGVIALGKTLQRD